MAFLASGFSGIVGVTLVGVAAPVVLNDSSYHDAGPEGLLMSALFALVAVAAHLLLLAVPAFFLLRNRIAFTRRNTALAGAICAALPGMAFKLWTLPASGGWVNGLLTVFSPLSLFLMPLGALCGWLFWTLIVTAPRRA